jgi:twinkle protein
VNGDRVLSVCRYAAKVLKVKHIVIDSLMKCGFNEDDYNGQKGFVDQLCAIAKDFAVHIHLVHHSRKREDESKPPGKMDAKGTGAIIDQVDNCITVFRNKRKEVQMSMGQGDKDAYDALMIVDKQRHGEWEGNLALWYDVESQQYLPAYQHPRLDLMQK